MGLVFLSLHVSFWVVAAVVHSDQSTRQISCLVEKEGIFLKARPSAVKSLGGPFIRPVFLTMRNPKPQILIRKTR